MAFLIDGFNLMYKFPDLEELMYLHRLNEARAGLLNILKDYQKIKKTQMRVVFDGKKEPAHDLRSERVGTIDVYYSLDFSADFLIKEFIKKELNPKMVTVVTSDKDIIFFINRFKVKSIKSEDFAEMVKKTLEEDLMEKIPEKEINPTMTDEDISFWEKLFRNKK